MFNIKSFYGADSVEDTIATLTADPQSQIINRGTDVLIRIRKGKDAGRGLVSIHNIPELKGVSLEEDGIIIIQPATPFSHITNGPIIEKHFSMLGKAVDQVGGPQVRNTTTIGGNICNGTTFADSTSTMCALNATVVLRGPEGIREVPIIELYTDPGRTVRKQNEVYTAFKITGENYREWEGHYIKCGKHRTMEIAALGYAMRVKLSPDKTVLKDVRLAYDVATPTPVCCYEAEEALRGKQVSDATIYNLFANKTLSQVNPRTSWRASREFHLQPIGELARRALKTSIALAGGKADA